MNSGDYKRLTSVAVNGHESDPEVEKIARERLRIEFYILDGRTQFLRPYARKLHSSIKKRFRDRYFAAYLELIWAIISESVQVPTRLKGASFEKTVKMCARIAYAAIIEKVTEELLAETEPAASGSPTV
jgi:RNAse (barnase) inhibitor barstar